VLATFLEEDFPDTATASMEVEFAYWDPTEPPDCVVSKPVAYREKDFAFAAAMLQSGLIDPTTLARRIDRLPASLDPLEQKRLRSWLKA
jgi:hypothetical protein